MGIKAFPKPEPLGTAAPTGEPALSRHLSILLLLALAFTTVTVWIDNTWALETFQITIFALVIVQVARGFRPGRQPSSSHWARWLLLLVPAWGILQILMHTTSSSFETRAEVLRWGSLVGVFFLSQETLPSHVQRWRFLNLFLGFATGMAVLCLMQLNTSHGQLLWFIPTPFEDIYATFQNKNNYSQFVELALPIALWGAVRDGWRSWWYVLSASVLYASAIGAASRAGFVLSSAELLIIPALGLSKMGRANAAQLRSVMLMFLIIPIVAGAFTFAVGWEAIRVRFEEKDPYAIRREFFIAAVHMVKDRPLTGFGLGTFEQAYQAYAVRDFPFFANHAHNDWAEFAADGGIPFLLLLLIPFLAAIPAAFRHPWALGLVATTLNAWVDYPFPRPAVSGWMFALLGMLLVARGGEPVRKAAASLAA